MTPEQLLAAFIAAGFDTPEKVQALLDMAGKQMNLRALDLQIEELQKTQASERHAQSNTHLEQLTVLNTQRAALVAAITAPAA